MDARTVLNVQINALNTELSSIYAQFVLNQMKVLDAEVSTGDKDADFRLADTAKTTKTNIAMQTRMIEVREAKLTELQLEQAKLKE